MAPSDYRKVRADNLVQAAWVDDRPYLPHVSVVVVRDNCTDDAGCAADNVLLDASSVKAAAVEIMLLLRQLQQPPAIESVLLRAEIQQISAVANHLSVERVMGGRTNILYRVSGLGSAAFGVDVVLLRVFGAEGMIDRDEENSVFAALSVSGLAPPYYGRFANGRVEGWMDGMRPLETAELSVGAISRGIAESLATLHAGFDLPANLRMTEPSLWTQLNDWLDRAEKATFQNEKEASTATSLQLKEKIRPELAWLKKRVTAVISSDDDAIVFCHNDLLAANILYDDTAGSIQLIDFEYGGVNFRAFDIANHFNEYAGGPPDISSPNYALLPNDAQQRDFIRTYLQSAAVRAARRKNGDSRPCDVNVTEEKVDGMMEEVEIFLLANHFYWGLWGVNQAATVGCAGYDYLLYASNRIQHYWITKREARSLLIEKG